MKIQNKQLLDTGDANELSLEILSFAGGENQISEDHVTLNSEARVNENWEILSIGGMQRISGFSKVGTGVSPISGTKPSVLGHFHFNESDLTSRVLGVIDDDLVTITGTAVSIASGGAGAFTVDTECTAVEYGDKTVITNADDNLQMYDDTLGLTTPTDLPTEAREGIYKHKTRLYAEGGSRRVYSSRAGTGNIDEADFWSKANDASNIDLPDYTKGSLPEFPTGDSIATFTLRKSFAVYGFPNVAYVPIPNSWGLWNRKTLVEGNGGAFGFTMFPSKCVWFWDKTRFVSITEGVDWIDDIDEDKAMSATFHENKYIFVFNDDATKSYPNKMKIFDTKFGIWLERPINSNVADTFGIPFVLDKQNNELYCWSSQTWNIYELETGTSDNGENTECNYKTKNFTSRDFVFSNSGKQFPVDEVTIKLTGIRIQFYGTTGSFTFQWTADRGKGSGSIVFDLTSEGDLLNSTFTLNTSKLSTNIPDKKESHSLGNAAIGKEFNFQILHNGISTKPKIKKIKIHAIALEEG